jgi:redox-sensitive bicupin YhaK (pirin superfamily)
MTDTTLSPLVRGVDHVHGILELGPDGQVDRKAIVLPPGNFERFDPFLMLAEDWFSRPGFDWHPHRGIETVTVVLDGALEHGDSRGNAGVLAPGDVQWMTAGSGIIHRELAYRDEHVHTLQLWVNLPAADKMVESQYRDFTAAAMAATAPAGVEVLAVPQHRPITVLQLTIEPGRSYDVALPVGDRAFLYLRDGIVDVGRDGDRLAPGQVAWTDPVLPGPSAAAAVAATSTLPLRVPDDAEVPARLLLASGAPLREPVVARGPFVMNTEAQILEAFADFRRGRFGPMPRLARVTS